MKHILIVDDEHQVRSMLKKMLEREGFHTIVASDGNEGMSLLDEEPVDLVITDIIMPEKDGLEIIPELRIIYPDVPVIAISGGGRVSPKNYLDMARLLGAEAIFEKPVKKEELINAVKKALKIS